MKPNRIIFLIFCLFSVPGFAQIITTEPAIPVASEAVTIYFDATEGNEGLKDFSGEIYAHTGVLTVNSSGTGDWKYVKTSWGENTDDTKLTQVSTNLYSLNISPSIRDFYAVPETETITQMAFVFRNSDGSITGKDAGNADIFVDVFEEGLTISISNPDRNKVVEAGTDIDFEAAVSESVSIGLYLNQDSVKNITSTSISHTFNFDTPGDYWIKVFADNGEETGSDSVFIHVMDSQVEEALPYGLEYGINYIDNNTVQLVLHAPGKETVFAVGDFNEWTPSSAARMKLDEDIYWLTINNLEAGKEYAFQYLVDGDLYIADPYTEKVLDPNDDKWILSSTYPDLKEYPSTFASGNTSLIQTAQNPYLWTNMEFTAPEKENLVIYELLVRDFIENHDWNTLIDTLDYFTRLGINAIEIMPFNEFEGNESWGYNPSFFFAADKYYGPKEDLQAFVDSCHGRGIAVIMDLVLNHSFSESPLVQLYYNGATGKVSADNPWYNVDSPNQDYFWGFDFNHEAQVTKDFIDRVNSFWLTEYNLDGFRFDFTKGFTNTTGNGYSYDQARINILKRMSDKIWEVNPDAYVIFEHLTDNSEEKVLSDYGIMLWGNINYNYNEASMGWLEDNKSDFSWVSYKKRGWTKPHLIGYMESHDEERLMFKNLLYGNSTDTYNIQDLSTALARQELAGAFFFTIPGPKMIWQFGELGYDYSIDYNDRVGNKPIRWDYMRGPRRELYQVYSALINLKTTEPAFSTTDFQLNLAYAAKRIELNHTDMDVRIIGNFDVIESTIDPNFSQPGNWFNYFSGETLAVTDVNSLITLAPGEYRIYTNKQLEQPVIIDEIQQEKVLESGTIIYPVPATEILHVSTSSDLSYISVFDINGRLVLKNSAGGQKQTINVAGLNGGLYFLKTEFKNKPAEYLKFIKEE